MIASASGPMFVAGVSGEWLRVFTDPSVTWEDIEKTMYEALNGAFEGEAYGFSKVGLHSCIRSDLNVSFARGSVHVCARVRVYEMQSSRSPESQSHLVMSAKE